MDNQPVIKIGDWIIIGNPSTRYCHDGLVMSICGSDISVGYMQDVSKAVKDDVTWRGTHWEFLYSGVSGIDLRDSEAAIVRRGKILKY